MPKKPNARGFTIIEVLIVLAVAGLIMLIVFQAIPAFERGNRNGERKQDVASILKQVSTYQLDNSANFPSQSDLDCNKLVFYNAASCTDVQVDSTKTAPTIPRSTDITKVYVYGSYKCAADSSATNQGADYRNVAALYAVESGDGSGTPQCQQL